MKYSISSILRTLVLVYLTVVPLLTQSQSASWNIQLERSSLNCTANQVCYHLAVQRASTNNWALGDQNYRLFFDGDLMTVTTVTSLLSNTIYGPASIDQNIKVSGQGQEAASPLDDIDDNLGFLDFSIVQSDKSNPAAATQINSSFTPVAEICLDVAADVTTDPNGDSCLSFYHSRLSTAGSITNQYTVISENNTAGNTITTSGLGYDDLTSMDGAAACLGTDCSTCATQGGDTDSDGICDNDDCAPTNAALPTTPGIACDDNDPMTENDVYLADGCTCQGTPIPMPDEQAWDIQLIQSFLDCSGNQVCYQLELAGNNSSFALGDQNYRLFFDGDLMTVLTVSSLLPSNIYAPVSIDQNIKISGQGQENSSPLDDIDDNLGFLDFSIIQSDKSSPSGATQISSGIFSPIAEICVEVAPTAINMDACLSFYHSRPSTAGSVTNQYTVVSENNAPNSTISTFGVNYDDLTAADGDLACLRDDCEEGGDWDIQLTRSFLNCDNNQACYQLEVQNVQGAAWALGDQNYRLFFDGELMDVVSVTSLLPSTFYSPVNIDQNIEVTGQGQEASSPLDDIDSNLGFLDFSIILSDKSNPNDVVQLEPQTFTAIAEICVEGMLQTVDDCFSIYHSRPSTAGSFTNQYTVISENDAPNSTVPTAGNSYDDLTPEEEAACLGLACQERGWDIQLSLGEVDCEAEQACYQLEVRNNNGADWRLGDQNYRLFFDGDLMTVTSVSSLLPPAIYAAANIDQNIKVSGEGQEADSPLDDIDDNLGFLDFSIIQLNKDNPDNATLVTSSDFVGVAEICVDLIPLVFEDVNLENCVSFYHSRPATAGSFTNQYTVISENDAPGSTAETTGFIYDDLTSEDGPASCLILECEDLVCDIAVNLSQPIYNDNNTPSNLTDDTFTFTATITGSNAQGWTGGGQSGTYGQTVTYGPYPVDQEGAVFTIQDLALGETCSVSIGVNMNSCVYTGACICCESND